MSEQQPSPNAVNFIPISVAGDVDPVTTETTVNFAATMDYPGQPDLALGFYEIQQTSPNNISMSQLTVSPTPAVTWSNGIANFSLYMNDAIFDQLSSNQANIGVTVSIVGTPSWGMATFSVSLPDPEPTSNPTQPGGPAGGLGN